MPSLDGQVPMYAMKRMKSKTAVEEEQPASSLQPANDTEKVRNEAQIIAEIKPKSKFVARYYYD